VTENGKSGHCWSNEIIAGNHDTSIPTIATPVVFVHSGPSSHTSQRNFLSLQSKGFLRSAKQLAKRG
ncbi:hypothetical protein COCC4DRAFT_29955, partial [Bipolaris maydis ATCC 48331]